MQWFIKGVKNYATFTGRAHRTEFWMYALVYFVINVICQLVDHMVLNMNLLSPIMSLGLFIPSLAIGIRRLHDTNRSGWWQLLPIVNLVFFCFKGDAGENTYGPALSYNPAD